MLSAQRFVAEAEVIEQAGAEVLDQHVRFGSEPPSAGEVTGIGEIECDAALVAVDGVEVGRLTAAVIWRSPGAGVIPHARTLDLDDLGAKVGEQHRRKGPGEHP